MSDNLDIEMSIRHKGVDYVCDFTVSFDIVNPQSDIYRPNGDDAVDVGQDEVNFTFVQMKSALVRDGDTWRSVTDSETLSDINEFLLDWCRDEPSMHTEAFKHFKGHE